MELDEERILALTDQVLGFASNWNAGRADEHIATKIDELRTRFTQGGLDLTPADVIDRVVEHEAKQWDDSARTMATRLETDVAIAVQQVEDEIAAAQVLPATVEPLVTRQERQQEELIALLTEDRLRARFERGTRRQALDAYQQADEQTQLGRRLVNFLETFWRMLAFVDDPAMDVQAIPEWQEALDARRLARVPSHLLDWRDRLHQAQRHVTFTETLRHLRSGRGIARRPKPMTMAIR